MHCLAAAQAGDIDVHGRTGVGLSSRCMSRTQASCWPPKALSSPLHLLGAATTVRAAHRAQPRPSAALWHLCSVPVMLQASRSSIGAGNKMVCCRCTSAGPVACIGGVRGPPARLHGRRGAGVLAWCGTRGLWQCKRWRAGAGGRATRAQLLGGRRAGQGRGCSRQHGC